MSDNVQSVTADLFNADATTQKLGITKRQLYHLVKRRLLKRHPAFRSLMFRKRDLEAFISMS